MFRNSQTTLLAALFAALSLASARAQPIPAAQGLSPERKTQLEQLIEAAKKEGAINYTDAVIQPETNDALDAAFHKYYGLPASFKVNYTLSSTGNLITRLDQEIGAKRITMDVGAIAAPTWVFERAAAGDLLQYDSPQYEHYENVFAAGMGQKGYFAIAGIYMFIPMWSEDHLKFAGNSWKDILTAVPPGRMIAGDAKNSTSHLATYVGLRQVLGVDFFRELARLKPSLLVRSEQIATRLISGQDLMTSSGTPSRAMQNNLQGAKLKLLFPPEGVLPLPDCMFILNGSPHPNAAKLWIDFILSEEGQSILATKEALGSGRTGFKSPMPEYAPPLTSINAIKVDWKNMKTQDLQKLQAEWVSIFAP
jgi:iron(III) transport system substrate-binding protein